MTKCAILGASGHGKVVGEIVSLNQFNCIDFFDDDYPNKSHVEHWPVCGTFIDLKERCLEYDIVVVAIGENSTRYKKQLELESLGATFSVLAHPSAVISQFASISPGTVVMANACVNPFAKVGKACIINTNSTIEHDCLVQAGVHVSPSASLGGGAQIGLCSWVGIGASVRHMISIGANVIVGAGAAVTSNVADCSTVVGIPARPKH
ncbi:acetyltransferase [Vibrio rotiferianus]|uniref:acetyltransferase n=1 Tax=Vibrio rotiferianus TaxID=190895 RepID=UPI00390AC593